MNTNDRLSEVSPPYKVDHPILKKLKTETRKSSMTDDEFTDERFTVDWRSTIIAYSTSNRSFNQEEEEIRVKKRKRESSQGSIPEETKLTTQHPYAQIDYPSKMNETSQFSKTPFPNKNKLYFYYIDICEDPREHPGDVFLFGKIFTQGTQDIDKSCCIVVKQNKRQVYLVPSEYQKPFTEQYKDGTLNEIEVNFSGIEQEFRRKLPPSYQEATIFKIVNRNYCFDLPILHGKRKYLKVKYDGTFPPINGNIEGKTFSHIIGTSTTLLESFIIKKRLKGPQWLEFDDFKEQTSNNKQSWCPQELIVNFKSIKAATEFRAPNPPLKVMSLAVKKLKTNESLELAVISAASFEKVDIDNNVTLGGSDLTSPKSATIIRSMNGADYPNEFAAKARKIEHLVNIEKSETDLITKLINEIQSLDPDIICMHDAESFLLLERVRRLKIQNWSQFSRLKKKFPVEGSKTFKIRHATSGRLICDTFLSAKEFLKETDYSLSYLTNNFLREGREDYGENLTKTDFTNSDHLLKIISHTQRDALLCSKIMFKLQILPLTKLLTCIAGNTWNKSLQYARAERNDMMLIHEFRDRKYIYPDRVNTQKDNQVNLGDEVNKERGQPYQQKYTGGLVLDPKPGLYKKSVLLLDFNSLYPSIVREYNICFTTLSFSPKIIEGNNMVTLNQLESEYFDLENIASQQGNVEDFNLSDVKQIDNQFSVLPSILESLVKQRRAVIRSRDEEKNENKKEIYTLKEKAVKLVANTACGCLGCPKSRFYVKSIAATITTLGRHVLKDSVRTVQGQLGLTVIYGDTDSLMIETETTNIHEAIGLGKKIQKAINKKYKCLEIGIDAVFMPLLLLKKKKYAAMQLKNLRDFLTPSVKAEPIFERHVKGLDMVRRDWCLIAKRAGALVLNEILSTKGLDSMVDEIKNRLIKLETQIRQETQPSEFIITKQLTKHPYEYKDDKGLPHVQVAKRMLENIPNRNLSHHYIPYIMIKREKEGCRLRAVHRDEFANNKFEIDIDWYMSQQVFPSIQRLLAVIPGCLLSELSGLLKLNEVKSKNARKKSEKDGIDDFLIQYFDSLKLSSRTKISTPKLFVSCPQCLKEQEFGEPNIATPFICIDSTCGGVLNCMQIFNVVRLKINENPRDLVWLKNLKPAFDMLRESEHFSIKEKDSIQKFKHYVNSIFETIAKQSLDLSSIFSKFKEIDQNNNK